MPPEFLRFFILVHIDCVASAPEGPSPRNIRHKKREKGKEEGKAGTKEGKSGETGREEEGERDGRKLQEGSSRAPWAPLDKARPGGGALGEGFELPW